MNFFFKTTLSLILTSSIPALIMPMNFDDIDIFNDPLVNAFVDENDWSIYRDASDIVTCLDDLKIIDLLKIRFFLRTSPLNSRSVLDLPSFIPFRDYEKSKTFGFHIFYNETARMAFVKNRSDVSAYLAIKTRELREAIRATLEEINKLIAPLDIDTDMVLALFENLTVQERRAGLLLYFMRSFEKWYFEAQMPLYYRERNYFLTEEEQNFVEQELGQADPEDQADLEKNHLISDRFGGGDLRMYLGYKLQDEGNWETMLGGFITFPISFTIGSGFFGSVYKKNCCPPLFDLALLCGDEIDGELIEEQGEQFLLKALDNTSGTLLDTHLGRNKHVGLGAFARFKTPLSYFIALPWATNFVFKTQFSCEYLTPANQVRGFVEKDDSRDFEGRTFQNLPEKEAEEALAFLTQKITDRLFPFNLCTRVQPGFIFHYNSKFVYECPRVGFYVGSDYWLQTQEKLSNIRRPRRLRGKTLDIEAARLPLAFQGKVSGGVFGKHVGDRNRIWTFGLNVEFPTWNSGIGDDITITFNVDVNF